MSDLYAVTTTFLDGATSTVPCSTGFALLADDYQLCDDGGFVLLPKRHVRRIDFRRLPSLLAAQPALKVVSVEDEITAEPSQPA